jgi:6-phosphogluconolactonase (cycloisomerase 2 family)
VDPAANYVYVVNSGDNTLSAFAFDPSSGALAAVSGSPFTVGNGPSFVAVDSAGRFLYVTNGTDGTISAFTINSSSGALSPISGSPFKAGTNPLSATVDPANRFLLVTNWPNRTGAQPLAVTDDSSIQPLIGVGTHGAGITVFTINSTSGALTLVTGSPFTAVNGGIGPSFVAVDPTDQFVYVPDFNMGVVGALTLNSSTGQLTALPTSPYSVGINPDGVTVDPSGRFVYVANYGSNHVTGFWLMPGSGALVPLGTFAARQGPGAIVIGQGTAGVQYQPQFAYVATGGNTSGSTGTNDIWGFSMDPVAGGLSLLGSSPFADGFSPTFATSDLRGQYLYVANNCSDPACAASAGSVSAYTIAPTTGNLTAAPSSPFLAGVNPLGAVVDPSERFVYVMNGSDFTISAYTLNPATGALSPIVGSPFPLSFGSMLELTPMAPAPFSLQASGGLGLEAVPNYLSLVLAYSYSPPPKSNSSVQGSNVDPASTLTIDPTGQFLYAGSGCADGSCSGIVWAYTISPSTGALTSSSHLAAGSNPTAMVVEPKGNYLYFTDSFTGQVFAFLINQTNSGALSVISGSPFTAGEQPSSIAIDPTGRFLYVANAGSSNISAYTIDPAGSGALTPIPTSPFFATGTTPVSISVDVSGQFAYVVCQGDNTVWAYSIDQVSGGLTPMASSPYPAGQLPVSMTTTGKSQ